MTKEDAMKMLESAPRGSKPSRVNASLNQAQAVEIVEKWIVGLPNGALISSLFEKRVYQVCRNQRTPRY